MSPDRMVASASLPHTASMLNIWCKVTVDFILNVGKKKAAADLGGTKMTLFWNSRLFLR